MLRMRMMKEAGCWWNRLDSVCQSALTSVNPTMSMKGSLTLPVVRFLIEGSEATVAIAGLVFAVAVATGYRHS